MKFGKFLLRTIVGGIVGIIFLNAFGGPNAMQALGLAILCTAGLSLIVIIPVAYLIGLLCTIWFLPFGEEPEIPPRNSSSTKEDAGGYIQRKALEIFIQNQINRRKDWESIRNECRSAGWSENAIQDAFDAIKTQKENISAW